jgi:hypothetical protein
VRVRLIRLRVIAAAATLLWAASTVAVFLAYRSTSPLYVLVAATPVVGTMAGLVAIAWPPLVREHRASVAVAWLGLLTLLVLAPSFADLAGEEAAGSATPLLPSPGAAYGWFLALAGTALFAGLGVSRRLLGVTSVPRARLALASLIAAALLALGSGISGVAALATQLPVTSPAETAPLARSDWGPTDPALLPPACATALRVPSSAVVGIDATLSLDGRQVGAASLSGVRSGVDESWQATVDGALEPSPSETAAVGGGPRVSAAPPSGGRLELGYTRVGGSAWLRTGNGRWRAAPLAELLTIPVENGLPQPTPTVIDRRTLDTGLIAADLSDPARLAAEDVGLELVGGARARHCRLLTGGILALQGFRPLRWLIGQPPLSDEPALNAWRGSLDWWVFGDGELGMATVSVEGLPAAGSAPGLQETLQATLTARDRGSRRTVAEPAP